MGQPSNTGFVYSETCDARFGSPYTALFHCADTKKPGAPGFLAGQVGADAKAAAAKLGMLRVAVNGMNPIASKPL